MNQRRKEIMAEIILVMKKGKDLGHDPIKFAEARFPDIPLQVLAEAAWSLDDDETEAWWLQMERTIDGEIVRLALERGDKNN